MRLSRYNMFNFRMKYRTFVRRLILCLFFMGSMLQGCRENRRRGHEPVKVEISGPRLFSDYGCVKCHSMEGEELYGPPLNEIWHKRILVTRDNKKLDLKVDRKYLIRSIEDPGYEKASGFERRTMPETSLSSRETKALVDYIISVNKTNH